MIRLPIAAFGALVVATIGAFFVTQHIKVRTPLFTGVRRSPTTISPLHGGICGTVYHRADTLTFYLLHRSDNVSVYVIDEGGDIVRTLAAGVHMQGGAHPVRKYFTWDGRDDSGRVVSDGTYHYRIALLGQGRTIDETSLPVTVKDAVPHPVITSVAPALVSPGTPVTINYHDYHRSGLVELYRTDLPDWWLHKPVKGIATKWDHSSVEWDGMIAQRPAPAGTYLVGFAMTDAACNSGTFPARLPPRSGSTPHAGVTLRYLAAAPTLSPVAAGSRALVYVDSRQRPYTWTLSRAGMRKAVGHGTGNGAVLRVRLPRGDGAGVYVLSLRSDGRRTSVPLIASATGAGTRAKVLVVLPALTWQGQNPVDDDGDGIPDTLDGGGPIRLARPFANGLPAGFSDEASLLAYLDRAHLPYDLTTDVALANGSGPQLSGHRAVVFAGTERWLPSPVTPLLRSFVADGGNVLSVGIDSLRRTATLRSDHALAPTAPAATDVFGARPGQLVAPGANLILVLRDGLGIFATTSQAFLGFHTFEPITPPAQATTAPSSAAGTSSTTAAIVGFKAGRGTVVEIGLAGFGSALSHNVDAQELVRQAWTVLGH
jgi:hypothetical protein